MYFVLCLVNNFNKENLCSGRWWRRLVSKSVFVLLICVEMDLIALCFSYCYIFFYFLCVRVVFFFLYLHFSGSLEKCYMDFFSSIYV